MSAVRFWSACGAGLPAAPPVVCERCGTSHSRNAKPCANAVVVDDDDRVLLVRRAHAPWEGMWCAPGGFCELGEHPIETAEREVLEETGVRARVTGYIGVWLDAYADEPADDGETISVGYYQAAPLGYEGPSDPKEVSEVGWFGWDDLPTELAPQRTLVAVLAVARHAHARGAAATELPDRPR